MKVLILKVVRPEGNSDFDKGFFYPSTGFVSDPNWDPSPQNGCGLHGLLWGEGSSIGHFPGHRWLVIEADEENVVPYLNHVKFKEGNIIFYGDKKDAYRLIKEKRPPNKSYVMGDDLLIFEENGSTGQYSTAAGQEYVEINGGLGSRIITGFKSVSNVGDHGVAVSGGYGTAFSKYHGVSLVSSDGLASSGDFGQSFCTDIGGSAETGKFGVAFSRYGAKVRGGLGSILIGVYFCNGVHNVITGIVGQNGIKENTWYVVFDGAWKEV